MAKRCEFCGGVFKPNSNSQKYCKDCVKEVIRQYWRKAGKKRRIINPERIRKIERKSSKKYKERHPERVKASQQRFSRKDSTKESHKLRLRKYYKRGRKLALAYKGGVCEVCGSTKSLVFHHLNPNEKKCNPAQLFQCSWKLIKDELDKCQLVCSKCHKRIHMGWK